MDNYQSSYQLSLNFSPVLKVPADPKERGQYFTDFKNILSAEREKIQKWHRSGAGGREVVQIQTGLIDEVLKHIVRSMAALVQFESFPVLQEFSLIAVGGYGRGELNPFSDIDLLFLLPKKKIHPEADAFIQDFISVLWGLGLEIGHGVRRVKDCITLAKEDLTVQTSMIDMRFLIGNDSLYEELRSSLRKNVLIKNFQKILNNKLEEHLTGTGSISERICVPEPDIKNGPGGLRYYHTALWGVAAYLGSPSLMEIGKELVLSEKEMHDYYRSIEFFLRVRNELHYLSQKKNDFLWKDLQSQLARNLGYKKQEEGSVVQRFMQDYFLHATNIYEYSEIIFKRCLQKKQTYIKKVIAEFQRQDLGHGFFSADSTLYFSGDPKKNFAENKNLFFELFALCQKHSLDLDPELKGQIRMNLDLIDATFFEQYPVGSFISQALDNPQSAKHLRIMHEVGILGKVLPEFGKTHCLVRYDLFHQYTSDEHSLRMIQFLDDLENPSDKSLPDLRKLYKKSPYKPLLKLAALLHSLAKAPNLKDNSSNHNDLAAVSDRLNLEHHQRENLYFLLDNLYTMPESAFHKEFQHPDTIPELSHLVATQGHLNLLYLISYAELKAAAADMWTIWKQFLLSELYLLIRNHIQNPTSPKKKSLSAKFEVYNQLQKDFFVWEIEQHFEGMPDEYLQTTPSEAIALHIRILRSLEGEDFVLDVKFNEAGFHHNVTLACHGKKEPLKNLVGIMTSKNMNILGAQVFLMQDGVVITTLQVGRPDGSSHESDAIWMDTEHHLEDILNHKVQMRTLLSNRKRFVAADPSKGPKVPKIQIDNTSNTEYTVLWVEAQDHLGMLYKLVKTLSDFGIQIYHAKISLKGNRGIDVFYIKLNQQKILYKRLIRQIRDRLINVLLIDEVEDVE